MDTQKKSAVISTTTTVPGTTIQPTTFPLSTTTITNPPSTAQPTTPPATTQYTTAQAGPTVLIGDPPATCTMRPETKGCSLELYKLHGSLWTLIKQRGPALKNSNLDYTLQAFATATTMIGDTTTSGTTFPPSTTTTTNPPSTAQPTTLPETAQPTTVPVISTKTTVPGTTIQPTTFPLSTTTTTNPPSTAQPTTPPATAQSTTAKASTTTPGTTGPLTTFLKSLTTATNPPSTPQPTTSPATTQVTTGQATGSTIQSATTVVTLPTTSTDSVTTPLRPTTIPTTATPSTVIWTSTTGSSTTQLPTTQSPTTPSTATDSTTIPSTTSATTAIPTTTGPCTNSSTNATARPKFDTLQEAYPTYEDYPRDALKLKEDMGLPNWLFENGRPNTCAIRMSKAFHDAGLGIDRSRVDKSKCDTKTAGVNGKGKEYIIRALFFRCYLRAIWGPPDICDVKGEDDVKGKKGILIFTGCEGFGQHIDLWDGESCSMGCAYFDRCSSVEFYELR